jgi:hypothetical protein
MRSNWTSRGSQTDVVDLLDPPGGLMVGMGAWTRVRRRAREFGPICSARWGPRARCGSPPLRPVTTMVGWRGLLACSARKVCGIEDEHVVAFPLDPATVGESAERLVRRLSGRANQLSDLLLRQVVGHS